MTFFLSKIRKFTSICISGDAPLSGCDTVIIRKLITCALNIRFEGFLALFNFFALHSQVIETILTEISF